MSAGPPPGHRRFVCMICMHVYDEVEGDPDSGIAPGTLWEEVPADWKCPQCGASKSFFENEAMFQQLTPRDENVPREEPPELPPARPEGDGSAQA